MIVLAKPGPVGAEYRICWEADGLLAADTFFIYAADRIEPVARSDDPRELSRWAFDHDADVVHHLYDLRLAP
jgi:hypothetical protein